MDAQLRNADGSLIYRTGLEYDTRNRLTALKETLPIRPFSTGYTYDNDNRVTGMTFDGENALSYTYDNLGRVATRTTSPLSSTYSYVGGGYGADSTTPLVSSIQQTGISFAYTYDNRGNITSETRNGATTTYAYDALGQLVRVNDPHENATWVYNYDRGGNITSKVKYSFTTGALGAAIETIPYAYGDANWKDKLTAYNGTAITYDAIGNPLNDGTWNYTWTAGRQLAQMAKDGMTIQYKYDHNGLRIAKVVNGVETKYILNGKQLTHLHRGNDWMHFFYDAQGRPAKVRYNGTIYSYILNLQGDIVGIIDTNGNVVVEYKYDAWGKHLSTAGSMAGSLGNLNPFRYRGYVYDEETGLYYLRGRYYNSELQRFINADTLMKQKRFAGKHNLFVYASNNPAMFIDDNGHEPSSVARSIVAACKLALYNILYRDANCYGFALKRNEKVYVGEKGENMPKSLNDLAAVCAGVESDGKTLGIRRIESMTSEIEDDEYRIALRVGSAEVKSLSTGEPMVINDYHFMKQEADGRWMHKPGNRPVQYLPEGETPETVSWDLPYQTGALACKGFYDSDIIYFAVKKR